MDRLQLGRDRGKRTVRSFPGRQRRAAADYKWRRHLLLRAEMVARQQEALVE